MNNLPMIIKRNRKFFKAFCSQCGMDRGYKAKRELYKICRKCSIGNTNLSFRQKNRDTFCSTQGCNNKIRSLNLCFKHFKDSKGSSLVGQVINCILCCNLFLKKADAQMYCSSACNTRSYYHRNRDSIRLRRNADPRIHLSSERWRLKNKAKVSENLRKRREHDLNFKISGNLRSRLNQAVKRKQKSGSAIANLGCSISELMNYLEKLWQLGMNWDNYGGLSGWQIDHIKPLSLFDLTDPSQVKLACHYTNLQPLWKIDNQKKSNKYEFH